MKLPLSFCLLILLLFSVFSCQSQPVYNIQANLVFFYYPDLDEAEKFYGETIGLKKVLDYGFAKIYQISQSSYIGLVDETRGMHKPTEPKTVTLAFVTNEIDEWYAYLQEQGVKIRNPLGDATRHPTRGFVALDPAGYFLEFERFLDFPQNEKLLPRLAAVKPFYPSPEQNTTRPQSLGILANVIWLYYQDIPEAQRFYEENLDLKLLVDQGFAKVYTSSSSAYIGLVDGAQGLHGFTEEKAVNVCFFSDQIDAWFARMQESGVKIRDPLEDAENFPVRTFVIYDVGGYFLEFDRFLEDERNHKILQSLQRNH